MTEKPTHYLELHRIIRSSELPKFTGLRRTQIDALIKRGQFPQPVKLSERRKGWLEAELVSWQQSRIAGREKQGAR